MQQVKVTYRTERGALARLVRTADPALKVGAPADAADALVVLLLTDDDSPATVARITPLVADNPAPAWDDWVKWARIAHRAALSWKKINRPHVAADMFRDRDWYLKQARRQQVRALRK